MKDAHKMKKPGRPPAPRLLNLKKGLLWGAGRNPSWAGVATWTFNFARSTLKTSKTSPPPWFARTT